MERELAKVIVHPASIEWMRREASEERRREREAREAERSEFADWWRYGGREAVGNFVCFVLTVAMCAGLVWLVVTLQPN